MRRSIMSVISSRVVLLLHSSLRRRNHPTHSHVEHGIHRGRRRPRLGAGVLTSTGKSILPRPEEDIRW